MHKLKSQWLVIGVLGAATMVLGATGIPLVSADEVSGQAVTENAGMDNQNLYFKLFI
jgi:hypothetical protein